MFICLIMFICLYVLHLQDMPRARTRLFTARQAADLLGQGDTSASTRDQTPPTVNPSPTSNTFVSSRDNTPPTVNPSPTAAAGTTPTQGTSIPRGGSTGESQAANLSTAETGIIYILNIIYMIENIRY